MTERRKKLIEVALPLEAINDASAYDKMPGIGPHPKGIHHWWARLPLPTARAVLFASVVDDPSSHPEKFPTEEAQNVERERLFGLIRQLMQKKMHDHPEIYAKAHAEMLKHADGKLPPVLDPFSGGGSIPLEAARLGLEAHAADLNPIAVLLNKCNLELVPRWLDYPPVNLKSQEDMFGKKGCVGSSGLAEDVRYYGRIVRERAIKKIGHLYPKVKLPREYGGRETNIIAWIWARTVASPNPATEGVHVPLISTYWLSTKKGNLAWLEPVVEKSKKTYHFEVRTGMPENRALISQGTKVGKGSNFSCILTGTGINGEYIQAQAKSSMLRNRLIAIVADLGRGKCYVSATDEQQALAEQSTPTWFPEELLSSHPQYMGAPRYGMKRFGDLFTSRQLTTMVALSDLIQDVYKDVLRDAQAGRLVDSEAAEYAKTITTFLALALDRCADFNCALSTWKPSGQQQMHLFTRQAIPMVWDFTEANLLGEKAICWHKAVNLTAGALERIPVGPVTIGSANQIDAAASWNDVRGLLISTDPPYYDNIPYSDLSDFFYVWLRRTIGQLHPELFSTVLTPKTPELVASSLRHDGDLMAAKEHFELGFRKAFTALRENMDPRFPLTVYYAFKQEDEKGNNENVEASNNGVDRTTGWETLLDALLGSGFQITATWPVRASQAWRMRAMGSNALASYIVLACCPRSSDAPQCSRRDFLNELRKKIPDALKHLQQGNIAPVDLAQASIGPGMAIFSQYVRVVEADGEPMTVRSALVRINQVLDEVLAEQEGEFDADTRWAVAWFEQFGMEKGDFGVAEILSKAKNTSVRGLVEAGVLSSRSSKVQLLAREDLPVDWDPITDKRLTDWEATQHLIRVLDQDCESSAAILLKKLGGHGEVARDLAYRLFSICDRKGWATEALAYNSLILAWPEISKLARQASESTTTVGKEGELFE